MDTKPHKTSFHDDHEGTGRELLSERMDRIERKLDMVIDFFNIHPDRVPDRSRKELREKAREAVFRLQNKAKRPGEIIHQPKQ